MYKRMRELLELSRAIQSCIVGAVGKPEPAYTAKLVSDLPQKANGIFKTRGFGFGGAFIHQRPCVTPVVQFDCRFSLAADIVAVMDWQSGRPICKYEDLQGCQDRWSRLIWDLLWETLDAPFTCAAAGYPRTAKGNRLSKDLTAHLKWLKRCAESGQNVEAPSFCTAVNDASERMEDEGFGLLIIDEEVEGET